MTSASRCPFCGVGFVPHQSLIARLLSIAGGKEICARCGRKFGRRDGEHVSHIYDKLLADFQARLGKGIKAMNICDRAEVLIEFGLHMDNAKVASIEMLLRALTELLEPQLGGLARGCEGRIDIKSVKKGGCEVVDIDALVENGSHCRRRLRIARIDSDGFIQADLAPQEAISSKFVAR